MINTFRVRDDILTRTKLINANSLVTRIEHVTKLNQELNEELNTQIALLYSRFLDYPRFSFEL